MDCVHNVLKEEWGKRFNFIGWFNFSFPSRIGMPGELTKYVNCDLVKCSALSNWKDYFHSVSSVNYTLVQNLAFYSDSWIIFFNQFRHFFSFHINLYNVLNRTIFSKSWTKNDTAFMYAQSHIHILQSSIYSASASASASYMPMHLIKQHFWLGLKESWQNKNTPEALKNNFRMK